MGLVELDMQGAHEVCVAMEFVKADMLRAKNKFFEDVRQNLSPDAWVGDSKAQFDRAVYLIEDTIDDLTDAIERAKNAYIEMGNTIKKADSYCADGIF